MSREIQELMDKEADKREQQTLAQAVINIMKKLKYSVEQAMDLLEVPQSERTTIAGIVNAK